MRYCTSYIIIITVSKLRGILKWKIFFFVSSSVSNIDIDVMKKVKDDKSSKNLNSNEKFVNVHEFASKIKQQQNQIKFEF